MFALAGYWPDTGGLEFLQYLAVCGAGKPIHHHLANMRPHAFNSLQVIKRGSAQGIEITEGTRQLLCSYFADTANPKRSDQPAKRALA